ncbi:HTH-type transcriptional activator AllS [Buttiauxella sp. A111]|uniref:HTH-type transcriptional activator AllS n=1 Tax=Buttiauxella sp. A111 TaxID=2563088 RepID=UPI0010D4A435|nr:HTH-type transcriptional activator AllS [Buttiauxella sp. A111]GDX07437.1 HTH-type transcriptional activator AllS [Buttiauxella sp. A111]
MLDHETIRTFIKVAETESFSQAAAVLHKTPAAISYRIKTLEEHVGTQLFMRTTRTVNLTLAGKHLLEHCRQWLSWVDAMPNELQQINAGVETQVNIVVNNLLYQPHVAATFLAWLHQHFPFTQFQLSRQVYMGVWDALLYDDFHLAIGVTGSESLSNNISLHTLGEISWLFVIAPNHPLALNEEKVISEDRLRRYPAINIDDTSRTLTRRVAWLLPGQKEIKVPDVSTKLECHLKGLGIGFLPANICQPWIDSGQLITRQVERARQPSQLSLAWKSAGSGKAIREIVTRFQHHDEAIRGFLENIDRPAGYIP